MYVYSIGFVYIALKAGEILRSGLWGVVRSSVVRAPAA